MDNLFVVIPAGIRFKRNNMKHPQGVAEYLEHALNQRKDWTGTIKAAISSTREESLKLVEKEAKEYIQIIINNCDYGNLKMSDFTLDYSSNYIRENLFWASTNCISSIQLTD